MADLDVYLKTGERLGLKDIELKNFVTAEREREEKREKERIDREERNMERQMKKLELEHAVEMERAKSMSSSGGGGAKAKLPKLPNFNEKTDSMEAYLKRFERFAEGAGWSRGHWASNLSALLQGRALDVYSRLATSDANDYDKLKTSLLKRFHLTEEGFRSKFRTCKPEQGETAPQFVIRLENYVTSWMSQSGTPKTFDGLLDLMLREQFMNSSPKPLQLFLKERKFDSVKDMAESAERYDDAHSQGLVFKNRESETRPTESRQTTDPLHGKTCYNCKGKHLIRDCPSMRKVKTAAMSHSNQGKSSNSTFRSSDRRRVDNRHDWYTQGGPGSDKRYGKSQNQYAAGCLENANLANCCLDSDISGDSVTLECGHKLPVMSAACNDTIPDDGMPVLRGYVFDELVAVLRDTGCSGVVVRADIVPDKHFTGQTKRCVLIDGTVRIVPVARITVKTPYFSGTVDALAMKKPIYDLILGNIPGVKSPDDLDIEPKVNWAKQKPEGDVNLEEAVEQDWVSAELLQAVQTRAQKEAEKRKPRQLKVATPIGEVSPKDLGREQEDDDGISQLRERAITKEEKVSKDGGRTWIRNEGNIYYRYFQSPKIEGGRTFKQLIVPKRLRQHVLKVGHDSLLAGHLGVRKMTAKVLSEFYWPGVQGDISRYCRSCDLCQKTFPKGKVPKIPIGKMPIIDTPFSRVAIDLVGPIDPPTSSGKRFILTVVDYATRYPEAVALKRIDTETVSEALLEIFCRIGLPHEILSDRGTQFTSNLMKEIGRLLSIKQLTTTPYNPACNGLVERFNGTLKSMLKKMCAEQPKEWDRFLAPLLFAYREAPQESLGFSPFELLYGRTVRGPMSILRELWTNEIQDEDVKTTYQHVIDLRNKLEDTLKLAHDELKISQQRYKKYADRGRKTKQIKEGDKVLVLLPTDNNKLLMQFKGPYTVRKKVNEFDYVVEVKGIEKLYHANLLKKYYERDDHEKDDEVQCATIVEELDEEDMGFDYKRAVQVDLPNLRAKETINDVDVNPDLPEKQKAEVLTILNEFKDVITDVPGNTNVEEHKIRLTTETPVRSRPYPVPHALREEIKTETKMMLDSGIIEPSNSPFASPVVLVKKKDGSNRFCVDYRKVNKMTVFDAEPMSNIEEIFAKMQKATFFSKFDLTKGYWQVNMEESSKDATSFITSEGLYRFRKMPFGLVNAGATFNRMIRKVLDGVEHVENFVDDLIEHTETWQNHLCIFRGLLQRLRSAGLTIKPSKCKVGYTQVEFLGHKVGNGAIRPEDEKTAAISSSTRPRTKKQVRSFLGLVGYYRKFIPNFSTIAAPLTDLTKKFRPNVVDWEAEQEKAFVTLTRAITRSPILCLPDIEKEFFLRTDASDTGLGAVILQDHGGVKFPVCYASRKLLDREKNYSVIEKECLGVVWGIQKYEQYLYGKEFVLQTDHAPLVYLDRAKVANGRLMRWALALQAYRFRIEAIKGSENVGSDYLSRID